MRQLTLILLFLSAVLASAQDTDERTEVRTSSLSFSSGIHPTFTVVFENTDASTVENHWRDALKPISAEVKNKKELVAAAAVLPNLSRDTVRVIIKAEQPKKSTTVTAHVAILTTDGFIDPHSSAAVLESAKQYVYDHSIDLKRELATESHESSKKQLAQLERELQLLEREQTRAESTLERTRASGAEAVQDQERLSAELKEAEGKTSAARKRIVEAPGEESADALKESEKEERKVSGAFDRAKDKEADAIKKAADLEQQITKNLEDQELKRQAIQRQRELVDQLFQDLKNVR